MQRLSDVKDNELVKNKTIDSLKTKVNNLEKNISDATTLVHINQCSSDKQSLEKKIGDVEEKYPKKWFSGNNCFKYKN